MQVLSIKSRSPKSRVLSQQLGWPLASAEGYVDGEAYRRHGKNPLPPHLLVGIDEYARGFRAGYYGRPPSPKTLAGRFSDDLVREGRVE